VHQVYWVLANAQQADLAPAAVGLHHLLTEPVAPVRALPSVQEGVEIVVGEEQLTEAG
jgi:hypothetical protein